MSNTSYLWCSDYRGLYPSHKGDPYDPELHTVACDVDGVPLLWLALFRTTDLRQRTLELEGEKLRVIGPVAKTSEAVKQLLGSAPLLEEALPTLGPLGSHARMLAECLENADGRYVTVEWMEIAMAYADHAFERWVRRALGFFDDPSAEYAREAARQERLRSLTRITKIRMIRERATVGLAEAAEVLDRLKGDVTAAIRQFEGKKTQVERAADACATLRKRRSAEDDGSIGEVLQQISNVPPDVRLAPLEVMLRGEGLPDDTVSLVRVLGAAHHRPVPWEA